MIRAVDLILNGVPDLWAVSGIGIDWKVNHDEYVRVIGVLETLKADFINRAILYYTDEEMERLKSA